MNSTIARDKASAKASGTIRAGVSYYRRGSTVTVSVSNVNITNTSAVTLLGQVPSELAPPTQVFASGFATNTVSYVRADPDGKVYGFRSAQGDLLASITWGVA